MNGDVTDDDPSMGQGPTPGGAPSPGGPPGGGGAPPGGPPQPGGILAAMSRGQQGPQVSAPGPGNMADSMSLLQQAIGLIQQAALGLPPGSPLHRDALQSATRLSRHLGGGAGMGPAVGVQKTMLGDQLKRTIQNMMLQRILSSKGMAKPGQGGGGMPPQAPMPSTPLPGA